MASAHCMVPGTSNSIFLWQFGNKLINCGYRQVRCYINEANALPRWEGKLQQSAPRTKQSQAYFKIGAKTSTGRIRPPRRTHNGYKTKLTEKDEPNKRSCSSKQYLFMQCVCVRACVQERSNVNGRLHRSLITRSGAPAPHPARYVCLFSRTNWPVSLVLTYNQFLGDLLARGTLPGDSRGEITLVSR